MKRIRKALWRCYKNREKGRRFRERRRAAGLCFQCGDPRRPHALRCEGCARYNAAEAAAYKKFGFAKDLPAFWREHPELIENNDRVQQAAWEEEHAS